MTINAANPLARTSRHRTVLNKVPEVTVFLWIIKILCTTVGEHLVGAACG